MAHFSENNNCLRIRQFLISNRKDLIEATNDFRGVCLLRLPSCKPIEQQFHLKGLDNLIEQVTKTLNPDSTLITLGDVADLVYVHKAAMQVMRYQLWIAIKRKHPHSLEVHTALPQQHFGALVHTGYKASLHHTKTRIAYTYCPACDKTTKDYGGKKHTYHEYGTLMSDVWRDIECDLDGDITLIVERFADLFGMDLYQELRVLDLQPLKLRRHEATIQKKNITRSNGYGPYERQRDILLQGDCLETLRRLRSNSIDFAFADPPYNLRKKYVGYSDDRAISEYFTWCDEWLTELARVLRPGRTCAILNIPLWAIRHFLHMEKILNFQNWIVWEALSFPVRFIMPAHYSVLCFSKGKPRQLPGLHISNKAIRGHKQDPFGAMKPLGEGYCLRSACMSMREKLQVEDRGELTDIWWDIHRLKHNTRRVDHPCQLPPQLMYRLISVFTEPGEIVLDCFNGAGTTTLTAQQTGRHYIGIEMSEKYHELALSRHAELTTGIDPFRKAERILTAKNSPVPRMPKIRYEIPKKTLQLDIKRISREIGHLPSRDEVIHRGRYPIKYYDEYFASWGEVCAAARTTGMTEDRIKKDRHRPEQISLYEIEEVAVK